MNLSSKNLFARYYNWIYGELPNDLCSFFWGSLFAIGLSVFIVPGRLAANTGVGKQLGNGILLWLAYFFVVLMGNGVIEKFGYEFIGFWGVLVLGPLFGTVVIIIGLGVPVGLIAGGISIHEKVTESNTFEDTKEKVSDVVGAIRGKYCTKITWK